MTSKSPVTNPRRCVRTLAASLAAGWLLAPGAGATLTEPALAIYAADATRGSSGILLRVDGVFPYEHLVQQRYSLQLFVRERTRGTRFVNFSLPRTPTEGDLALLAGGLDGDSVWSVMWAGVPSETARLLHLGPGHIEVLLSPDFPSGPAEVQFFVIYAGWPILSAPVEFRVPEATR